MAGNRARGRQGVMFSPFGHRNQQAAVEHETCANLINGPFIFHGETNKAAEARFRVFAIGDGLSGGKR